MTDDWQAALVEVTVQKTEALARIAELEAALKPFARQHEVASSAQQYWRKELAEAARVLNKTEVGE